MFAALAGPDPADPATAGAEPFDADAALAFAVKDKRVAVLRDADLAGVGDAVGAAYLEAVTLFERLGARLAEARPAVALSACVEPTGQLIAYEAWQRWGGWVERNAPAMDPGTLSRLQGGSRLTATDHARLLAARSADQGRFHAWVQDFAGLLTPTVPVPAPVLDGSDQATLPFSPFTRAANWLDLPALALPCGFTRDGLPLSLQVLGKPRDEATVIGLGHAYQRATDWHERRPEI